MSDRFAPTEPGPRAEYQAPAAGAFPPVAPIVSTSPPQVIVPAKKGDRTFRVLLAVGVLVAVGGVTFAIGRVTAPAAATTRGGFGNGTFPTGGTGTGGTGQGGAAFGRGGGFGGGILVTGTVDSVSGTAMTLKQANGNTVTVTLAGTTTYHAQAAATAADVTPGKQVQVQITGGFGGPDAGGAPGASPAVGANGQGGAGAPNRTMTAADVTLVAP